VTGPLPAEIVVTIKTAKADGYEVGRLSTFLGRPMRHSGWFPDHVLRLFRRDKARFSDDIVHERVICDGPVARLICLLDHHPVLRLEDALRRGGSYSTAGAEKLASQREVWFGRGIVHGMWGFLRTYRLRLGLLDGRGGFL